jgi:ATP-dependent DNA helicase RecQ
LLSSKEILERFEGDRREFLAALFRQAKKGRVWLTVDAGEAANALGCARERVIRALDWLGEQQLLEVQAAGVRHRYRRRSNPDDLNALATALYGRLIQREAGELERLHQVYELATMKECSTGKLAAHFGEQLAAPCGHCSGCLGDHSALPPRGAVAIPPGMRAEIAPLIEEKSEVLASLRAVARFLCGVTSPKLSRAKLTGHRLFGALAEVPFGQVMSWAERY